MTPASDLSGGLHTATICADVDFPWTAGSARRERRIAAPAAARELGKDAFGPFNPRTAAGNGLMKTCIRWRDPEAPPPPDPGPLPDVPTLILNGTWDLSTPLADARREAARSPDAQLLVVPHGGHSSLTSQACAQRATYRFFADEPLGNPCR